ncbi:MAG: hypothetical protein KKG75_00525 [Nanoarchaeota archaeon]|nr:hypothetical protein [Nanoarchaeota archaeon]
MNDYFLEKLFEINHRMSIHEGNANKRLAIESAKILYQLCPYSYDLPNKFKLDFNNLKKLIENTIKSLPQSGLIPTRLRCIRNITASKYIKLLKDIELHFENRE